MSIRGQLYPNLFCYSLSDLHSYALHDKLVKTNCYSTFFDLISGKGNTAAIFRNFSKQIADTVISAKSEKELFTKLRKIHRELSFYKEDLINRLTSASLVSGGVRAEFRVRLCDLVSVSQALDKFFNEDRIKNCSYTFESSLIVRFATYNVELLYKQIASNFAQLLQSTQDERYNNYKIMQRIASISVLESLLSTTLFTGKTYSFAGSLVWNKSTVTTQSLELMKYVKSLNRPVFCSEFFSNNVFKIAASEDILNTIFGKLIRNSNFRFPPIKYMLQFEDINCTDIQRAELLWKIYFEELNMLSFLDNGAPKWKLESLDRAKITRLQRGMKFYGAVGGIFNLRNYENYNSWQNKVYMQLAYSWISRPIKPINSSVLESHLVQAIRNLGIEYVHCPGNETYDQYPAVRMELDLNDRTNAETAAAMSTSMQRDNEDQNERTEMMAVRGLINRTTKWEHVELEALFRGVVKYGAGKWVDILRDPLLCIYMNSRNSRSMGSKWNILKNAGIVIFNMNNGQWSVSDMFRDQYPEFYYPANELERAYSELSRQELQPRTMPHTPGINTLYSPENQQVLQVLRREETEHFHYGADDYGADDYGADDYGANDDIGYNSNNINQTANSMSDNLLIDSSESENSSGNTHIFLMFYSKLFLDIANDVLREIDEVMAEESVNIQSTFSHVPAGLLVRPPEQQNYRRITLILNQTSEITPTRLTSSAEIPSALGEINEEELESQIQSLPHSPPLTPPDSLNTFSQLNSTKRIRLVLTNNANFPETPLISSFPPVSNQYLEEFPVPSSPSEPVSPPNITLNTNNINPQRILGVNIDHIEEVFFSIMSNYVTSRKTISKLFAKIRSLPEGGHIFLNEIINDIAYVKRPDEESRMRMLEELQESGIIRFTAVKKNSIKIQKGSQFY